MSNQGKLMLQLALNAKQIHEKTKSQIITGRFTEKYEEPHPNPSNLASSAGGKTSNVNDSCSISSDDNSSLRHTSSSDSRSDSEIDQQSLDVVSDDSVRDKDCVPSAFLELILESPHKGKKRERCTDNWKTHQKKKMRNTGKAYTMNNKIQKMRPERKMKPPCGLKCRNKCSERISEEERQKIFHSYWDLGDVTLQRQFISNCIKTVQPKYRYVRSGGKRESRKYNSSFHFKIGEDEVRVCKLFLKNTLDINDRPIRTVLDKQNKLAGGLLEPDKRGQHGRHASIEPEIKKSVKEHIESIPKVSSRYMGARSSRTYICGPKSVADIHRDYVEKCKEQKVSYANYTMFYRIFKTEYNISFCVPKKDQCDICTYIQNAENE